MAEQHLSSIAHVAPEDWQSTPDSVKRLVESLASAGKDHPVSSSLPLLTQILDALPVGVSVHDAVGQLTYVNQMGKNILGISELLEVEADQLSKTFPVYRSITQELSPFAQLPIVRALAGEKVQVDNIEIHQQEQIVCLEAWGSAITDEQGRITHAIAVFQDITERKRIEARAQQMEQALRESENRYRQIVQAQTDFILRSLPDTTITFANAVLCHALGYTLEQVVGQKWINFANPEDLQITLQRLIELTPENSNFMTENRDRRADGRIGWTQWINQGIFDAQGNLIKIQSVGRDVTEQKRLEQALRQQVEQIKLVSTIAQRIRQSLHLKEILNTTVVEVKQLLQADRVVVFQFAFGLGGRIVAESVAPEWRVSLGAVIEDTCFQTGDGVAYQQGKTRAIANIDEAGLTDCHRELLKQFQVKANLVVPILLINKRQQASTQLWGLLIAHQCSAPREWQANQLALLDQIAVQLAIALQQAQVFEQAQTELAERQQAEAHLRATLVEKEVLLKEIHHRVKNNLQIVSGLLHLQTQGLNDPQIINAFRESQNRIETMSLIHKKLYTSSDIGQIDVADYIQTLANNVLTSYQIASGKVTLQTMIEPIILSLDQAIPCGLIINELVSNALKYAFPKGQSGTIHVKLCQAGRELELTIQDDGIGLPEGLDWRNTESLGFSLVYALATEQLEGRIAVDCHKGTKFKINFHNLP